MSSVTSFRDKLAAYPTEGRPGSGTTGQWTTKLDSGAQKRLIRPPHRRLRATRAGQRPRPLAFLKIGNFAPISEGLHIKGQTFPDVFLSVHVDI